MRGSLTLVSCFLGLRCRVRLGRAPLAGLFFVASCSPGIAGTVQSLATSDRSVFEQYAGRLCTVLTRTKNGKESSFERDCRLLENLAKGTSEACAGTDGNSDEARTPRPVEARFPGRTDVMHLCKEGRPPLALEQKSAVRFAVFGDMGVGENAASGKKQISVARRLRQECFDRDSKTPCDFVVTVGDNIYPDGAPDVFSSLFTERFEDVYKLLPPLPFFLVPGNHDYNGNGNVQAQVERTYFSRRWRMEKRNTPIGGLPAWLGIQMIDTTPLEKSNGDRAARLAEAKETLCGAMRWRFLVAHHPIVASGHHGPSAKARAFYDEVNAACPGVLQLSGHEHHQEYVFDKGVHQIIQGGGGAPVKPFTPGQYEHDPKRGKFHFTAAEHGFAVFEATQERLAFSFYGLSKETPLWSCVMSDPLGAPECTEGAFP